MDVSAYAARINPARFEPFRVEIRLASPLALPKGGGPPTLDAVVARLIADMLRGNRRPEPGEIVELPLPFARAGRQKQFYRASSLLVPGDKVYGTAFYIKRWDSSHEAALYWGEKPVLSRRVDTSRSYYKGYQIKLGYLACEKVEFYANGDRAEVERLLQRLHSLGHKRSQGYGRVKEVLVEPVAEDLSLWRDGQPQRPIPLEEAPPGDYYIAPAPYRDPYWDVRNWCLCALPMPL